MISALISRPMPGWTEIIFYSFIVCAMLQVALISLQGIAVLKWKPTTGAKALPPFTVIISARNEAENLKRLIPQLLRQEYPDFQVIVALDRCTDDSLPLMKEFERMDKRITTVIVDDLPDHFSPKKYALTLAVKACKTDWMVFTDADCEPASDRWLQSMGNQMEDHIDFVLGASPYRSNSTFLGKYIQYETFFTAHEYLSLAALRHPYMGVGRNMAYRKSEFIKSNGFNKFQNVMGGDDDLFVHYHAGGSHTQILLGKESLTYSDPKENWSTYWIQKKRHLSVGKYYKPGWKAFHTIKALTVLWLWASLAILASMNHFLMISLIVLGGYVVIKGWFYWMTGRKIGDGYTPLLFPIMELVHAVFVPLVSIVALSAKKVKWN